MSALFEEQGFTNITLVPSGGGVFEISIDGELHFSKKALGRFPQNTELKKLFDQSKD